MIKKKILEQLFPNVPPVQLEQTLSDNKNSLRHSIFSFTQPPSSFETLIIEITFASSTSEKLKLCDQILHCFCPNTSYRSKVLELQKNTLFKLPNELQKKLKDFRRPPSAVQIQQTLALLNTSHPEVTCAILKGLQPFGTELQKSIKQIQSLLHQPNTKITREALDLITSVPGGIERSITLIAPLLNYETTQLSALKTLQNSYKLPPETVIRIMQPILAKARKKPKEHLLEIRLIRQICQNNGVTLSIPSIDLHM